MFKKLILIFVFFFSLVPIAFGSVENNTDDYIYHKMLSLLHFENNNNISKDNSTIGLMGTVYDKGSSHFGIDTTDCMVGNCINISGDESTDDYYIQYNDTGVLSASSNFTVGCWARTDGQVTQQDIWNRNDDLGPGDWNSQYSSATFHWQSRTGSGTASASYVQSELMTGNWQFVVMRRNVTSTTTWVTSYVNASEVASGSVAGSSLNTIPLTLGIYELDIGNPDRRDWKGEFDECFYANYSMSWGDIVRLYDLGLAGEHLVPNVTAPPPPAAVGFPYINILNDKNTLGGRRILTTG